MDGIGARPGLLKQTNLSVIRRAIRDRGTATRLEIANATGISPTTVRSILTEMLERGEIDSAGYDASRGGRKAERYRFRPDRYHGAAFCVTDDQVHALLVDLSGDIVQSAGLHAQIDDAEAAIISYLDRMVQTYEIRAVGIGVPGVVDEGGYWRKKNSGDELRKVAIGDALSSRYDVPIVLENDLNAITLGFGRCYSKSFPQESPDDAHMAFVYFKKESVSAGFLSGGCLLRGFRQFAGELGLVPAGQNALLDDRLSAPAADGLYANVVSQVLCWICAVLNPQYIALGGPAFRKSCLGLIGDALSASLPGRMLPELLYAQDVWQDYYHGMACLTVDKIFEGVRLVRA